MVGSRKMHGFLYGERTMNNTIFTLKSWPRAIVHIDGDAFFTSCEEAIHPEWKGKPLAAGGERGIVTCASYAAKRMGIKRGVSMFEAKRICPELIAIPSDYETYSLFSRRMFNIMRRFTPQVEEYSIDEAFADLTGMRRALKGSYESIALQMRDAIENELGINVSVGLSITKVLAKIASKYQKPHGFTVIRGREIVPFLEALPVGSVWGIGEAAAEYMAKMGIKTALALARLSEAAARARFHKPVVETWRELRGESVFPVTAEQKSSYVTISKTKTFSPASSDRDYVFAHLLRNLESACVKARHYHLAPKRITAFLKKQNFDAEALEGKLNRPSSQPLELSGLLRTLFDGLWEKGETYRATGVILLDLAQDLQMQYSLFEDPLRAEKIRELYGAVDRLSGKYGRHTVHLGGSHSLAMRGDGRQGAATVREKTKLYGETALKHLQLPLLHSGRKI
jgi:DNA polymerase-4/DNA polymerase V